MSDQEWSPQDLRAWRSNLGWTGALAAEKLGISRESISALENGKHPIDRRTMLACLALTAHLESIPAGFGETHADRTEMAKAAAFQLLTGVYNVMVFHGHQPLAIHPAIAAATESLLAEAR